MTYAQEKELRSNRKTWAFWEAQPPGYRPIRSESRVGLRAIRLALARNLVAFKVFFQHFFRHRLNSQCIEPEYFRLRRRRDLRIAMSLSW